ncbi:MAG TPA: dipicolinate synthase subunit DpsA [Clostridiales bacterium]|nr:dipicolinate synthase subunit DpsA [Clostridiales bacterium]
MRKMEFTFIGGDNRQKEAAIILSEASSLVRVFGLEVMEHESIENYQELHSELFQSQVVMLPIPYKNQEGFIHIIDKDVHIEPKALFSKLRQGTRVIFGKQDKEIENLCKQYSVLGYDLLKEESFSIRNAIPTAEGAIQRAMERTDITLHGAKILILGFGRIGRVLSRMLHGIGSQVSIEARKNEDLAWIEESGCKAVSLKELDSVLKDQDIIFNTIPALILDRNKLEKINSNCIIIDLASHPGGVDFEAAREFGLSASLDLGLPGQVASKTAAAIICSVIQEILRDL